MLKTTASYVDPFDYHLEKCSLDCFKNFLEFARVHSSWPEDDKDELEHTVGSKKVVEKCNQKSLICLARDGDYILKHCGHQCIFEH